MRQPVGDERRRVGQRVLIHRTKCNVPDGQLGGTLFRAWAPSMPTTQAFFKVGLAATRADSPGSTDMARPRGATCDPYTSMLLKIVMTVPAEAKLGRSATTILPCSEPSAASMAATESKTSSATK